MKRLYRITITALMAFVSFIVIASAVVSLFYESAVIRFLKTYLDEHLRTQITVDDIRFRLLKGFPNATFELKNIVILSGENFSASDFSEINADTLLQARTITCEFDLISLINKQYELKQIDISRGYINFLIDKNNRNNLNVWKNPDDTPQAEFPVNLNSIRLNTMDLNLINQASQQQLFTTSERMIIKGTVDHKTFAFEAKGDLRINTLKSKNKIQLQETDLQVQFKSHYGQGEFSVQEGLATFNKTTCRFSGTANYNQDSKPFTLNIANLDFQISDLGALIPDVLNSSAGSFSADGNGRLNATINGSLSSVSKKYSIHSNVELEGVQLINHYSQRNIENINLAGIFSGTIPGDFTFQIDHFTSSVGDGQITGTFSAQDPDNRILTTKIQSTINLSKLFYFIELDSFENINGFVLADCTAEWPLKKNTSGSSGNFLNHLKQGQFIFYDVDFETVRGRRLQNINGTLLYNNTIKLDSVSVVIDENHYLLNGTIDNLSNYISRNDYLYANVSVSLNELDVSRYFHKASEKEQNQVNWSLNLPSRLYLNAKVHATKFIVNRFVADELDFNMVLHHDSAYINDFNFKFIDGSISGNALINQTGSDGFSVTCNTITNDIDIHELFIAFNNFTQRFIIDENVRGRMEGSVSFYAEWNSSLKLIPEKIRALATIEISNGELVQFEPMMKLSRYFDAEELMQVKFSTLKNQINIINSLITIPEMSINSSAFNITASGKHSFDNSFDYRLKILLSDVLFNRAKTRRREISEFYVEENMKNQSTIPLVISGTPDNYDVQFDKQRAFNLSGKNQPDAGNDIERNPDPSGFIIEWDEEISPLNNGQNSERNYSEDDYIIQWGEDDEDSTN